MVRTILNLRGSHILVLTCATPPDFRQRSAQVQAWSDNCKHIGLREIPHHGTGRFDTPQDDSISLESNTSLHLLHVSRCRKRRGRRRELSESIQNARGLFLPPTHVTRKRPHAHRTREPDTTRDRRPDNAWTRQPNSVAGGFTLSTKTTNTTGNDENFPLRFTTDSGVNAVQALPVSSERHRLRRVVVFPLSAGSAHGRGNTDRVGIRVQLRIGWQKTCPVQIRARKAKCCSMESALAPSRYPGLL
ncbi:UNVERIFIED_ORG: hypothetical protein J2Y81_007886 [Paraburkholderia sediminicola]|nr:hypothetical protein [Paraburkholderia sediminicola]